MGTLRSVISHFICAGFVLLGISLYGQTDTISVRESTTVETAIEDFVSGLEVDEQFDYSFLTDYLEELQRKPLNINSVQPEDLRFLPGMTEVLAVNLCQHRELYGNFTSIYELQAIKGYRQELIDQILPFVYCRTGGEKDINPGSKHASGPSVKELFTQLKGEFIQRSVFVLEDQRGYEKDSLGFSPYAGSKHRIYSRLRIRSGNNFSFALTGEKDPGERFAWDPEKKLYGYDFLSGHIAIRNFGSLKNLVVGDYTLQFGQGMVLSRGLGFGKSAESIRSLKMPALGIRPYSSVNENQFMRGLAATFAAGDLYLTAFYSNLQLDANQAEADTLFLNEEIGLVGLSTASLQTSGLHRTTSEIANRKSLGEEISGARLEYKVPDFTLGFTFYNQRFDRPLNRPVNAYNQFDFRGDRNDLQSIDFDWIKNNFNFFGEFARSRSGGLGGVLGVMGSLSPTVDIAIQARHFDKDFHSSKGYVFAERPTTIQNETGIYMGIQIFPSLKWIISGYFDQYYYPFNKFRAGFPTRGHEQMIQVLYKPKRGTQIYARFRADNKEQNGSQFPEGQKLQFIVPTQKLQARLHFQTSINRDLLIRNRIEYAWFREEGESEKRGMLIYQDLVWKLNFKFRITARYAIFDAPDYDARIYAYENDILGFFSIPPYYRTGSRYYLILNWKPIRGLEFWGRIAQTRLRDIDTFGSGNERINGDTRSEVKLQVRFKF